MCLEVGDASGAVEKFNKLLTDNVPLMPVDDNSLRYSSISCGHTNCGLRAVLGRAAADVHERAVLRDARELRELRRGGRR